MDNKEYTLYVLAILFVFFVAGVISYAVFWDSINHPTPEIRCGKLYQIDPEHTAQLMCNWEYVK